MLIFNLRKISSTYTKVYILDFFFPILENLFMLSYIMLVLMVRTNMWFRLPHVLNVKCWKCSSHWVGNSKYYIDKTDETTKSIDEVLCKLIFPWITGNVDSDDLKPPPLNLPAKIQEAEIPQRILKYSVLRIPWWSVVKTPCFHCRGCRSDPGWGIKILHGKLRSCMPCDQPPQIQCFGSVCPDHRFFFFNVIILFLWQSSLFLLSFSRQLCLAWMVSQVYLFWKLPFLIILLPFYFFFWLLERLSRFVLINKFLSPLGIFLN